MHRNIPNLLYCSSEPSGLVLEQSRKRDDNPSARIDALDFTKGFLVVLMVIYHSLNYSTQYHLPFRYLFFLPPSFILISGFLLSHIYLARSRAPDSRSTPRLLARGAKLFAVFAALNVVSQFVRSQNYHRPSLGLRGWLQESPEILLLGGSHVAAFDILLPIAYLLLLAPALLWMTRAHHLAVPALTIALLATCYSLDHSGDCPANLSLLTAGAIGMVLGLLPNSTVSRAARWLPLTIPAFGAQAWMGLKLGQPFLQQMLGAFLAVLVIYGSGVAVGSDAWVSRRLLTLGKYSLVAYIGQIGMFQIYTHVLGRPEPASPALLVMFAITLILTITMVEFLAWAQVQWKSFQVFYRTIAP